MLREFTQDVGRYKVGEVHDFPQGTWRNIAQNAMLPGETKPFTVPKKLLNIKGRTDPLNVRLDKFTKEVPWQKGGLRGGFVRQHAARQ